MDTQNITVPQGNTWTKLNIGTETAITIESIEETGVEVAKTDTATAPLDTLQGHSAPVGQKVSISDIKGAVWVRSPLGEAVIVIS